MQAGGCTSWDPALQQPLNFDKLLMRHIVLMQTIYRDSAHATPCSMKSTWLTILTFLPEAVTVCLGTMPKIRQHTHANILTEPAVFQKSMSGVVVQVGRCHTYVHAHSIGTNIVLASKYCSNLQDIQEPVRY